MRLLVAWFQIRAEAPKPNRYTDCWNDRAATALGHISRGGQPKPGRWGDSGRTWTATRKDAAPQPDRRRSRPLADRANLDDRGALDSPLERRRFATTIHDEAIHRPWDTPLVDEDSAEAEDPLITTSGEFELPACTECGSTAWQLVERMMDAKVCHRLDRTTISWTYVARRGRVGRHTFVCGACGADATEGASETLDLLLDDVRGLS